MTGYSFVFASAVLVLYGANASDFTINEQTDYPVRETCDVDYRLHENLSSILTNDVGIQILSDLRNNVKNMCLDPIAHNALVGLMDAIVDVSTDTNVAQTLGNIFFWTRKMIKAPYFRAAWDQTMIGCNMLFENNQLVFQLMNTVFDNLTMLINNPNFDDEFELVVKQLSLFNGIPKKIMYNTGARLFSLGNQKSDIQRQNSNMQRQNSNMQRQNSNLQRQNSNMQRQNSNLQRQNSNLQRQNSNRDRR